MNAKPLAHTCDDVAILNTNSYSGSFRQVAKIPSAFSMADEESTELLRGERRRGGRLSRVVAAVAAFALVALAAARFAPRDPDPSAARPRRGFADDATASCEEDDGCADGYLCDSGVCRAEATDDNAALGKGVDDMTDEKSDDQPDIIPHSETPRHAARRLPVRAVLQVRRDLVGDFERDVPGRLRGRREQRDDDDDRPKRDDATTGPNATRRGLGAHLAWHSARPRLHGSRPGRQCARRGHRREARW